MRISEVKICVTDITNALELGQNSVVESIVSYAKDVVKQGGTVVIEQRYENAPPTELARYSSEEELKDWKDKLDRVQELIQKK